MAAIGLALGYDPAYVAVHHLVRIIFLLATMPVLLRRIAEQLGKKIIPAGERLCGPL
jgi:uncharacterized membrane protein AbrB (regulator of aidB expression)